MEKGGAKAERGYPGPTRGPKYRPIQYSGGHAFDIAILR